MKNLKLTSLAMLAALMLSSAPSYGRLVQILHTNDTHSFLDSVEHRPSIGGAARLKGLIDSYKNKMAQEGIKTLVLDAGDFSEGNIYYMAKNGRKSFEVHNEMGYDIGTLGNHDYLMGTPELDKLLGEMDLKFSIVAANFEIDGKYKNLREKIKPFKEIEIDGIKIAVLGLTTSDIFYKWRILGGSIKNPIDTARVYETILKKQNKNDYIIALTHIGIMSDIKLAEKTRFIDLIVGGHSHTALFEPSYGVNKNKKQVPIVQAGMHTEFMGRLIVDIEKGRPLKIVKYELVPVLDNNIADDRMKALVEETEAELDGMYGKEWLNQKVGYSDLVASDIGGAHKWSYFIADALKEKTNADIAIHSADMNGSNYPVGDITRRSLINSFPRLFDVHDKLGWTIYTTKIKGVWLRLTIDALSYFGQPLTFSGIKMTYERGPLGFKIRNILINGKKVNPFKTYTVAFSEGIVKGAEGIDNRTVAILRSPKDTGFRIWETLEEKTRRSESVSITHINTDNHTIFY